MSDDEVLELLAGAPLEPVGRIVSASNVTLLCHVAAPGDVLAIYKPERGEAPLWDFPAGTLHRREVAAYLLDRLLGWGMVPPTVLREDAPFGRGSVQLFVAHDPDQHYFTLLEDPSVRDDLVRMVAFDVVANNADRKAGHVLRGHDGSIHLVDHGLTFHAEHKLRTVAWDFAGQRVPDSVHADVAAACRRLSDPRDPLAVELSGLLAVPEVHATVGRAGEVAALDRFPAPTGPRPYPWPPL